MRRVVACLWAALLWRRTAGVADEAGARVPAPRALVDAFADAPRHRDLVAGGSASGQEKGDSTSLRRGCS